MIPLVSVIIPTYNRAHLLQKALESLEAQTFRNFEVIVVDDGSNDSTDEIINNILKLKYVKIKHNGLPSIARNVGCNIAEGDYIAFLDSDDEWLPDKLQKQVDILDRFPIIGLVCTNAFVIEKGSNENNGQELKLYFPDTTHWGPKSLLELVKDNFVITSTMLVRRSLINLAGPFSEDLRLRAVEDYDLWLRLTCYSDIYFIEEGLAKYRDTGQSLRSEQSILDYWRGIILIYDRLIKFLVSRDLSDPVLKGMIYRQLFRTRRSLMAIKLKNRDLPGFFNSALVLARKHPVLFLTDFGQRIKSRFTKSQVLDNRKKDQTSNGKIRLHLGCGETYLEGYINIDFPSSEHNVQRTSRADLYADIVKLNYGPGKINEIRLHHVFEHFDRVTALFLLTNWYQWLEEGGQLIIETPDFRACSNYFIRTRSFESKSRLFRYLHGSNEADWALHQDGWYRNKFKLVLSSLGFTEIRFKYNHWKDTYNIIIITKKGYPVQTRDAQMGEVQKLLRLNMIDDSESEIQLLKVWMGKFSSLINNLCKY